MAGTIRNRSCDLHDLIFICNAFLMPFCSDQNFYFRPYKKTYCIEKPFSLSDMSTLPYPKKIFSQYLICETTNTGDSKRFINEAARAMGISATCEQHENLPQILTVLILDDSSATDTKRLREVIEDHGRDSTSRFSSDEYDATIKLNEIKKITMSLPPFNFADPHIRIEFTSSLRSTFSLILEAYKTINEFNSLTFFHFEINYIKSPPRWNNAMLFTEVRITAATQDVQKHDLISNLSYKLRKFKVNPGLVLLFDTSSILFYDPLPENKPCYPSVTKTWHNLIVLSLTYRQNSSKNYYILKLCGPFRMLFCQKGYSLGGIELNISPVNLKLQVDTFLEDLLIYDDRCTALGYIFEITRYGNKRPASGRYITTVQIHDDIWAFLDFEKVQITTTFGVIHLIKYGSSGHNWNGTITIFPVLSISRTAFLTTEYTFSDMNNKAICVLVSKVDPNVLVEKMIDCGCPSNDIGIGENKHVGRECNNCLLSRRMHGVFSRGYANDCNKCTKIEATTVLVRKNSSTFTFCDSELGFYTSFGRIFSLDKLRNHLDQLSAKLVDDAAPEVYKNHTAKKYLKKRNFLSTSAVQSPLNSTNDNIKQNISNTRFLETMAVFNKVNKMVIKGKDKKSSIFTIIKLGDIKPTDQNLTDIINFPPGNFEFISSSFIENTILVKSNTMNFIQTRSRNCGFDLRPPHPNKKKRKHFNLQGFNVSGITLNEAVLLGKIDKMCGGLISRDGDDLVTGTVRVFSRPEKRLSKYYKLIKKAISVAKISNIEIIEDQIKNGAFRTDILISFANEKEQQNFIDGVTQQLLFLRVYRKMSLPTRLHFTFFPVYTLYDPTNSLLFLFRLMFKRILSRNFLTGYVEKETIDEDESPYQQRHDQLNNLSSVLPSNKPSTDYNDNFKVTAPTTFRGFTLIQRVKKVSPLLNNEEKSKIRTVYRNQDGSQTKAVKYTVPAQEARAFAQVEKIRMQHNMQRVDPSTVHKGYCVELKAIVSREKLFLNVLTAIEWASGFGALDNFFFTADDQSRGVKTMINLCVTLEFQLMLAGQTCIDTSRHVPCNNFSVTVGLLNYQFSRISNCESTCLVQFRVLLGPTVVLKSFHGYAKQEHIQSDNIKLKSFCNNSCLKLPQRRLCYRYNFHSLNAIWFLDKMQDQSETVAIYYHLTENEDKNNVILSALNVDVRFGRIQIDTPRNIENVLCVTQNFDAGPSTMQYIETVVEPQPMSVILNKYLSNDERIKQAYVTDVDDDELLCLLAVDKEISKTFRNNRNSPDDSKSFTVKILLDDAPRHTFTIAKRIIDEAKWFGELKCLELTRLKNMKQKRALRTRPALTISFKDSADAARFWLHSTSIQGKPAMGGLIKNCFTITPLTNQTLYLPHRRSFAKLTFLLTTKTNQPHWIILTLNRAMKIWISTRAHVPVHNFAVNQWNLDPWRGHHLNLSTTAGQANSTVNIFNRSIYRPTKLLHIALDFLEMAGLSCTLNGVHEDHTVLIHFSVASEITDFLKMMVDETVGLKVTFKRLRIFSNALVLNTHNSTGTKSTDLYTKVVKVADKCKIKCEIKNIDYDIKTIILEMDDETRKFGTTGRRCDKYAVLVKLCDRAIDFSPEYYIKSVILAAQVYDESDDFGTVIYTEIDPDNCRFKINFERSKDADEFMIRAHAIKGLPITRWLEHIFDVTAFFTTKTRLLNPLARGVCMINNPEDFIDPELNVPLNLFVPFRNMTIVTVLITENETLRSHLITKTISKVGLGSFNVILPDDDRSVAIIHHATFHESPDAHSVNSLDYLNNFNVASGPKRNIDMCKVGGSLINETILVTRLPEEQDGFVVTINFMGERLQSTDDVDFMTLAAVLANNAASYGFINRTILV